MISNNKTKRRLCQSCSENLQSLFSHDTASVEEKHIKGLLKNNIHKSCEVMGVGLVYPKVEKRIDGLEFRD